MLKLQQMCFVEFLLKFCKCLILFFCKVVVGFVGILVSAIYFSYFFGNLLLKKINNFLNKN